MTLLPYKVNIALLCNRFFYPLPESMKVNVFHPKTPWGLPSDSIHIYNIANKNESPIHVAQLTRDNLESCPSEIPYYANIAALKLCGVSVIFSISKVQSLCSKLPQSSVVVPDQLIDVTKLRPKSYFYRMKSLINAPLDQPFCEKARNLLLKEEKKIDSQATLLCMEGPQTLTDAEKKMYSVIGADVVNMTSCPEAQLARELEMSYQPVCLVDNKEYDKVDLLTPPADLVGSEGPENYRKWILGRLNDFRDFESPYKGLIQSLNNMPGFSKLDNEAAKFLTFQLLLDGHEVPKELERQ